MNEPIIRKQQSSTSRRICITQVTCNELNENEGKISRVGCIIRYLSEEDTYTYLLNRSNQNYLSDFGGGIRQKESWIEGFSRELTEECPWMKENIIQSLCSGNDTLFFLEVSRKNTVRLLILITYTKRPTYLSLFHPTQEVKELVTMLEHQLVQTFTSTIGLNYGLLQLRRVVRQGLL